ncbi:CAP domain-containing protein [Hyphomonas sp.]|uniref:CAP domain-containing protein n=1 Tax=Hyphomonas sp. TaxID=87 RepID=UPI00391DC009
MKAVLASAILLLSMAPAASADELSGQMLTVHNRERAEVGAAPLVWNDDLARDAQRWADHLAATGVLEHAGRDENPNSGENLSMGSAGGYSMAQLAQGWADEKALFQFGTFPDVSTDGNWASVGHYTQMVWKSTARIGCASATGGGWDFLVCRYDPPGNYLGQTPW